MLYQLRRHPIPIEAEFDHCLVLTYAFPADALRPLLAPGLAVETLRGLGFLAVAMVQTRRLRPAGFPRLLGRDFFLCGYRVFCRHRDGQGRTRRGLRILRSDADRLAMVWGGNALTRYNYRRAAAELSLEDGRLRVRVSSLDGGGDIDVTADLASAPELPPEAPPGLPPGSPFVHEAEARRFAGPLPYTFDYEPETGSIIVIKGLREAWRPRPVRVDVRRCSFLDQPPLCDARPLLASAFHVAGVHYRWQRGVREPLVEAQA